MTAAIYSLTSFLHNEVMKKPCDEPFIRGIMAAAMDYNFVFPDGFDDFGTHDIDLIYVRTGGTEGLFKAAFPVLPSTPIRLLTSGESNSLAASMEILSYLRKNGSFGEILHGSPDYLASRLSGDTLVGLQIPVKNHSSIEKFNGSRVGVVGHPSDWLISSDVRPEDALENLGVELVNIPIGELIDFSLSTAAYKGVDLRGFEGAEIIYEGLKKMVAEYRLSAVTVRCFDLLEPLHNTGCLALARLNAEGIPASCEGDVPALLSMMVANRMSGCCGFQANPSRIDPQTGEITFAHCTVPFNMIERYRYTTHFESGMGVAIKGDIPTGPVTIFKIGPDARTRVCFKAELLRNLCEQNLCRTQIVVRCPEAIPYFFNDPIGNHHIIIPGHLDL